MAKSNSMVVMMLLIMAASFHLQSAVAQTRHVVGGALGWTVPPNGAASYTSWASKQTFRVGDTLVFNFTSGTHNVAEVSQDAYGPCTKTNPISTISNGPASLTLRTSGNHYYVCTVGTHCQIGQKITINVVASGSTPPTASSPTPTGTMPSNATTFSTAGVHVILIAVVLAYFGY